MVLQPLCDYLILCLSWLGLVTNWKKSNPHRLQSLQWVEYLGVPGRSVGTQMDGSTSDSTEAAVECCSDGTDCDAGTVAHGSSSPSVPLGHLLLDTPLGWVTLYVTVFTDASLLR